MALLPSRQAQNVAFQRLALAAVAATFALIVAGGFLPTSDSRLGCPDWPFCLGQILPVGSRETAVILDFSHRFLSMSAAVLVLSTFLAAWQGYRSEPWVVRPASLAVVLFIVQVVLGGASVLLNAPLINVSVHLGNTLLLLASLITVAMFSFGPQGTADQYSLKRRLLSALAIACLVATFVLIESGSVVAETFAGFACPTWPLCNGQVLSLSGTLVWIAITHRVLTIAAGLLILCTLFQTWRHYRHETLAIGALTVATVLFVMQILVGAIGVWHEFPLATQVLHLTVAASVWSAMVVFTLAAVKARHNLPRRVTVKSATA